MRSRHASQPFSTINYSPVRNIAATQTSRTEQQCLCGYPGNRCPLEEERKFLWNGDADDVDVVQQTGGLETQTASGPTSTAAMRSGVIRQNKTTQQQTKTVAFLTKQNIYFHEIWGFYDKNLLQRQKNNNYIMKFFILQPKLLNLRKEKLKRIFAKFWIFPTKSFKLQQKLTTLLNLTF